MKSIICPSVAVFNNLNSTGPLVFFKSLSWSWNQTSAGMMSDFGISGNISLTSISVQNGVPACSMFALSMVESHFFTVWSIWGMAMSSLDVNTSTAIFHSSVSAQPMSLQNF